MTPSADHPPGRRRKRGLSKTDVRLIVEGAIAGGMPVGRIDVVGGRISLFAVDGTTQRTDADDLQRRMDEAFGSDDD